MAVLTISREFRSGGQEVGAAVAERLAYQYVGKERILEEMGKVGDRWRKMVFDLDEAAPHCGNVTTYSTGGSSPWSNPRSMSMR